MQRLLILCAICLFPASALAADPPEETGYKPLFDGTSLAGWEGGGQPAELCWKVADGTILCTGEKGPWLRSKEQHGDYNLRLEYKLKAGGNSGVYIRVPESGNHHGNGAGIEVQVLDDADGRYRTIKPYQYTGSLYAIAPATKHVGLAPGEWNKLEINCKVTKYHVIHNGVTIVAADETTFPELKGRLTKGFLGLQNHSEEVWFRNLRIGPPLDLPIDPSSKQAAIKAEQLRELLAQPVLEPGTPQREVEAFCEARVVRLPAADAAERKSAEAWKTYIDNLRRKTLDEVVFRGEAAKWREYQGKVEWLEAIEGGEGYKIKKLRFEAVPGLWVPGLLYEPLKLDGKAPIFLNVNGHDGKGKAADYKQIRCINQAKRGIIALNLEWIGMGQLRTPGFAHTKLNQIDLCGTSGVAVHFLAMQRGLDILLAHPSADSTRVGVAGLSGGGWQTIVFSALEPRVTLSNPVAGYSSFVTRIHHYSDLGDSEQTPVDLAATADYAHLTAMLAPRVALLTFNEKDNCCFAAPHALPPLLEAARPVYQLFGQAEKLHEHINYDPGTHNFLRDNREALYKVIGQHWYAGDSAFSPNEIECEKEVKTAEELAVDLPADNLDLQKLAQKLTQPLPKARPEVERRAKVVQTLRLPQYVVSDAEAKRQSYGAVEIWEWQLKLGDVWTVPAVEFTPPAAKSTVLVLADGGRTAAAEAIEKHLAAGSRVVAVDPFYFGESKIKNKDWLFALLISSVGERPLGIQAAQVNALAWFGKDRWRDLRVEAVGPRSSLIALAAAACNERPIAGLTLHGCHKSLKDVISQGGQVNTTPEVFCFGLLEAADISDLAALAAPRKVEFLEK